MMTHLFFLIGLFALLGCEEPTANKPENMAHVTDAGLTAPPSTSQDAGETVTPTQPQDAGTCAVPSEPQDAGGIVIPPSPQDAGSAAGSPSMDAGAGPMEQGVLICVNDECTYQDPVSQLDWQGCPAGQTGEACVGSTPDQTHGNAVSYCEGLSWGGHDDWRLPHIDEFRSLIRGCPQNELGPGNTCPITHECSYSTGESNTCGIDFCEGCEEWGGGPGIDGCYAPAILPGMCGQSSWSASLQTETFVYLVNFRYGVVASTLKSPNYRRVRCVRSHTD